jgi:hypothetical protein
MQYTQTDYNRAQVVFLLDVDWAGQQYGFSSFPISFDGREYAGNLMAESMLAISQMYDMKSRQTL